MRAWLFSIWIAFGLTACAAGPSPSAVESDLNPAIHPLAGNPLAPKKIFVFLDGTRNDQQSKTNVWRLFKAVTEAGDVQTTALYLPGVGTTADPLDVGPQESVLLPLVEAALGKNMQPRILAGYRFIAQNHRPGDQVFIFGFSRGAHQARSLAGMIAYAGVPAPVAPGNMPSALSSNAAEDILELVKKQEDDDYASYWARWEPGMSPPLGNRLSVSTVPVDIQLLGVWDTVPGSSLKEYCGCKEKIGFVKKYFAWLIPGVDKGERYKIDTYPVIRKIAHAVSADEKRSKFNPVLVCAPPSETRYPTSVNELLFPGSHADVGGGYDEPKEDPDALLPSLSLNWMITELSGVYKPPSALAPVKANPLGLAHWSIGDSPANKFSHCLDRKISGIKADQSLTTRRDAGKAPLRIFGVIQEETYPKNCL